MDFLTRRKPGYRGAEKVLVNPSRIGFLCTDPEKVEHININKLAVEGLVERSLRRRFTRWALLSSQPRVPKSGSVCRRPARITRMFALYDMRILKAHSSDEQAKLASCLGQFHIDPSAAAAGMA
jgi:hypothetical protein